MLERAHSLTNCIESGEFMQLPKTHPPSPPSTIVTTDTTTDTQFSLYALRGETGRSDIRFAKAPSTRWTSEDTLDLSKPHSMLSESGIDMSLSLNASEMSEFIYYHSLREDRIQDLINPRHISAALQPPAVATHQEIAMLTPTMKVSSTPVPGSVPQVLRISDKRDNVNPNDLRNINTNMVRNGENFSDEGMQTDDATQEGGPASDPNGDILLSSTPGRTASFLTGASNLVYDSLSNSNSPCRFSVTYPLMHNAAGNSNIVSQAVHSETTNRQNGAETDVRLSAMFLTNEETALSFSQQSAQTNPHQSVATHLTPRYQSHQHRQPQQRQHPQQPDQHTQQTVLRPDGEHQLVCNSMDSTMVDPRDTVNYRMLTQLPSSHDHVSQDNSTELTTSSIDSTVAAAADVMSYIHQHGPVTYGHPDCLIRPATAAAAAPHWGSDEFELTRVGDDGVCRDTLSYHATFLPNGQRTGAPVNASLRHPLTSPQPAGYNRRVTSGDLPTSLEHLQLCNGGLTENSLQLRSGQPQAGFSYGMQRENELKSELRNALPAQLPPSQNHLAGHPCRAMMANGSMNTQHLVAGPRALNTTVPVLHPRHGHMQLPIQEMEEINTKALAQRISAELKRYSIPQAVFAQRVLCRSQGTLSDLLRNPKPWSKLKSGRETFRRMWKWLQEPEFQPCKRKEVQHMKTADGRQVKKPRLVFTDIQRRTLHAIFKETKRPSKEMQSTIAQQLGLEVSTVANFFMNARRRSLDKWQEDCSKGSSLADSPSPGSASSRCSQRQSSRTTGHLKEGDFAVGGPYSPGQRGRPVGSTIVYSAPASTNKMDNGTYPPGARNDMERMLRCGSLNASNKFSNHPRPPHNIDEQFNVCGSQVFSSVHRGGPAPFASSNPQAQVSTVPHPINEGLSQLTCNYTESRLPTHHKLHSVPQNAHPTPAQSHPLQPHHQQQQHPYQHTSQQQQPQQLLQYAELTERTEAFPVGQQNATSPHPNVLGPMGFANHSIQNSGAPLTQPTVSFPPTGLHAHLPLGPSQLGLFQPNGNVSSSGIRNHSFMMRDFVGANAFDPNFLNTISSGQRALTQQALELCNSLAAANGATLREKTPEQFTNYQEVRNSSSASFPAHQTKSDELRDNDFIEDGNEEEYGEGEEEEDEDEENEDTDNEELERARSNSCSPDGSVERIPSVELNSSKRQGLDEVHSEYFCNNELDTFKDELSSLSDAICGLISSDENDPTDTT
ncbi:unnamed protein product [Dicrocoelium dendriticum]|nr:unnamed protein product [Dicrocoelium dendriticum]